MDYFTVMNAGPCLGGQHEVIVGDGDPSLSFASSPTWATTYDEIEVKPCDLGLGDCVDCVGNSSPRNGDDSDGSSDNSEKLSTHDAIKMSPEHFFEPHQNAQETKKKSLDNVEVFNAKDDYAQLLRGCKIIKTEADDYLNTISSASEDEFMESQSEEEQPCDVRSNTRHDSGGSAVNSDEENETRCINKQSISITSQSKIIVIKDPIKIASAKPDLHNADAIEDEKMSKGKTSFRSNGNIKPRLSYAQLIAEALMGAEQRKLTLNDIYVKINARHPYYSLGGDRGNVMSPPNWQNAVRHNLTLNKAFVKVPRPANEGRGSFWSLAPGSEKDIFKRLLRQQSITNTTSTPISKHIYNRITSSSPAQITLAAPASKAKQVTTVATQTYPSSIRFDVSHSFLSSSSVQTPSPSPSPPLPLSKQYGMQQTSSNAAKLHTPNIKVIRSISALKGDAPNEGNKIIPVASNRANSSTRSTKPTIIYVTLPKRASKT